MPLFDGLGHVALKVRDLDASLEFYRKLGFPEMLRLLDKDGAPWIEDPDGNRIELMQMAPDCLQLEAIARLRREAVEA